MAQSSTNEVRRDEPESQMSVKQLIAQATRPTFATTSSGGTINREGGTLRTNRPFGKLRSLLQKEDVILVGLCFLMAGGFFLLALSNIGWAGDFLTIDSLFIMAVSLLLAAVFLSIPLTWLHAQGMLKNPFALDADADALVVDTTPIHFEGSTKLFLSILGWLLGLTLVEVFLAYIEVQLTLMLTILIGLSLIKAFLIMAYFMHLWFERRTLVLSLIPMLVVCVCLLFVFFPDSFRSLNLRMYR